MQESVIKLECCKSGAVPGCSDRAACISEYSIARGGTGRGKNAALLVQLCSDAQISAGGEPASLLRAHPMAVEVKSGRLETGLCLDKVIE